MAFAWLLDSACITWISVRLCTFMSRLKQLLWDRLEESGWRYDVEEHAKGTAAGLIPVQAQQLP